LNEEFSMYQSPPPAFTWTRRHWIAALGTGLLGAAIAMAIIIVGGGVVADGRRGIVMGGVQSLLVPLLSATIKPPRSSAKARRWILAVAAAVALWAAVDLAGTVYEGQFFTEYSFLLGWLGANIGPLMVWGRYRRRLAQGR
jgi:hypothetical protein